MRKITAPSEIPVGVPVYVYGTGEGGRVVRSAMTRAQGVAFAGFIDSFRSGETDGATIRHVDAFLADHPPDAVALIASHAYREIANTLRRRGFTAYINAYPLVLKEMADAPEAPGRTALRIARHFRAIVLEGIALLVLTCIALLARGREKPVDVGLGGIAILNNIHHKRALIRQGFSAETFCCVPYPLSDEFDVKIYQGEGALSALWWRIAVFRHAAFRYKILYFYFDNSLLFASDWLWRFEPQLLRLARIRSVVMPYGGDVQDMTRSPNLLFKHRRALDYPELGLLRRRVSRRIDLWTEHADHIIAGCEWVDYMHSWHTLMLAHFSIGIGPDDAPPPRSEEAEWGEGEHQRPLRVLHAPNHRFIKGTDLLIEAIDGLRREGENIELVIVEAATNAEVLAAMESVDVVADQFVIGWYALFALEAMSHGKPVMVFIRPDLHAFYRDAGLLRPGEIAESLIETGPGEIKDRLLWCLRHRRRLPEIGLHGKAFARRHHSLEAVGAVFARINRDLGVLASSSAAAR
jgi:glycosyltransferase involved in cell wall biosynthesis